MRPRATLPASDTDTDELTHQVRQWAAILGFRWAGPGGAFRLDQHGAACWRVYSEWAGTGVTADIDAQSGELLEIADAPFENVGEPLQMPAELLPPAEEVTEFVRTRLRQIGWQLPGQLEAQWSQGGQRWRVFDPNLAHNQNVVAEVVGKRASLRLLRVIDGRADPHR